MDTIKLLESQRNDLLQQISEIGELRPGNLSSFHRKCYRPNCHCAKPGDPGHLGWQLTRKDEHQKTIRHNIPKHALETTRKQVEEYSRLKTLVGQFAEINDQLCQARLRAGQAEKKTLRQTSRKNR